MKHLSLFILSLLCVLLVSCDKDEPQKPKTERELIIGDWEKKTEFYERYNEKGELVRLDLFPEFTGGFSMTYTTEHYTLSGGGLVETGTYEYKVDQDTHYLQLEEINNLMSRTYYIDSISNSELRVHYKVENYDYSSGSEVYDGYVIYYESYRKK